MSRAIYTHFMIRKLKTSFDREQAAAAGLILLGAILRLRQYLTGRSLWADEAMLALNIVNRSLLQFFQPLDYDQGAPVGFLWIEKIVNLLLGRSEYALRLFPLLAGMASLWLFYLLLKRMTKGPGLLTALALFALNPRLVYYSSEVKQYIVDVLISISLMLLSFHLLDARPQKRDFLLLAVFGVIALWFSHPALFVLAGIGMSLAIVYLHRREYFNLTHMLIAGVLWLLTIGFLYVFVLQSLRQDAYIQEYWQGAFLPFPPWNDLGWFPLSIWENIGVQFGIPYATYFVFGMLLVGWAILWKRNQNYAMILGFIFVLTLIASALKLYPVYERMILFLIPLGLLLIGITVEAWYESLRRQPTLSTLSTALLAGYLLYGPLVTSASYFIQPKYYEHIRPAMGFLQASWRPGDAMYVSNGAVPAFEYYAPLYGLSQVRYISNPRQDYQDPSNFARQLEALRGQRRVWILLSHVYEKRGFNEKDFILEDLSRIGEKKREFRLPGSSVYLYLFDLGN